MRPAPQARHLVSVAILAAVSAAYGYSAIFDDDLSSTQIGIASAAIKRHEGDLFACDPVLGASQLWRLHTPVFYGLLELVLFPTGYRDPVLPFRAMTSIVAMTYLCGMYALLYRQCRSWSVAVFVAVLSSAAIRTLGGSHWGVGPLEYVTPMGICMAATPLIVLAFLRYAEEADAPAGHQWRLILVFGCVGLMGNLYLVAAINLAIVLLVVYLAKMRFRLQCLPTAIACALAAVIGALPYIGYFCTLRSQLTLAGAQAPEKLVYDALRVGRLAGLYPDLAKSLLSWLIYTGALCIPAAAVLVRIERFRARELRCWVWFIGGGLFVSIGLHGVSQLAGVIRHTGPPVIAFLQASAFVMLPLYVLAAQGITNLFRLVRNHRWLLRWACVAAMAAWLIPSDNLQVVRHLAYDGATMFMEEADKPLRVQKLHALREERAELEDIAKWARGTNRRSVFVTDRNEFRMLARRSIVVNRDDVIYYYYLSPQNLGIWKDRLEQQAKLFRNPADMPGLVKFRRSMSEQEDFAEAVNWYAILPANLAATVGAEPAWWGKHYRVFLIPPELPGPGTPTAPAAQRNPPPHAQEPQGHSPPNP